MDIQTLDNLGEATIKLRRAYFMYNHLREFLGLNDVELSEDAKNNFMLYRDSLESIVDILGDYIDSSITIIDKEISNGSNCKD